MSNKQYVTIVDQTLSSYLSRISKVKMLSDVEEYNLAIQWKEDGNQDAAKLLMISHLPLVVKIAYKYKNYGQSVTELIAEGNIGLIKAIYKFNPYKGFRLATYAMWWIKAYITEYILNSWSLVKSGSIIGRKKLFFSLKRIKQKLGINTNQISDKQAKYISETFQVSQEDVKYVNDMLENKDLSLEAPVFSSDTSSTTYGSILPDYNNPEEITSKKEEVSYCKSMISNVLKELNDRERFILEQRFLIEAPRSLSDIGLELKLSRERVRQIEQKALNKAKSYINAHK